VQSQATSSLEAADALEWGLLSQAQCLRKETAWTTSLLIKKAQKTSRLLSSGMAVVICSNSIVFCQIKSGNYIHVNEQHHKEYHAQ
jgi:hypothetical protein